MDKLLASFKFLQLVHAQTSLLHTGWPRFGLWGQGMHRIPHRRHQSVGSQLHRAFRRRLCIRLLCTRSDFFYTMNMVFISVHADFLRELLIHELYRGTQTSIQ